LLSKQSGKKKKKVQRRHRRGGGREKKKKGKKKKRTRQLSHFDFQQRGEKRLGGLVGGEGPASIPAPGEKKTERERVARKGKEKGKGKIQILAGGGSCLEEGKRRTEKGWTREREKRKKGKERKGLVFSLSPSFDVRSEWKKGEEEELGRASSMRGGKKKKKKKKGNLPNSSQPTKDGGRKERGNVPALQTEKRGRPEKKKKRGEKKGKKGGGELCVS